MSKIDKNSYEISPAPRCAVSQSEDEGGATPHVQRSVGSVTLGHLAEVQTRSGLRLHVRPITSDDATAMAELMSAISEDDVRFRFPTDGQRSLQRMTKVDHERTENFVAIDSTSNIVATAMLASDASGEKAEVAIAVRAGYRDRGIGWTLLDYVVGYSGTHGLTSVESTVSKDDHTVIELETEMGFTASPYPGDASRLLLTKRFATIQPSEG